MPGNNLKEIFRVHLTKNYNSRFGYLVSILSNLFFQQAHKENFSNFAIQSFCIEFFSLLQKKKKNQKTRKNPKSDNKALLLWQKRKTFESEKRSREKIFSPQSLRDYIYVVQLH